MLLTGKVELLLLLVISFVFFGPCRFPVAVIPTASCSGAAIEPMNSAYI
jgi:Sec-independent protein translocase protein TatA